MNQRQIFKVLYWKNIDHRLFKKNETNKNKYTDKVYKILPQVHKKHASITDVISKPAHFK